MKISRAYKVEIDPTNKQITLFRKHLGSSRFIYNWALYNRICNHHVRQSLEWLDDEMEIDGYVFKTYEYTTLKIGKRKVSFAIYENLTKFDQSAELTQYKKEVDWLNEPDAMTLISTLRDLDNAYKNFFDRVKKGKEKPGFPNHRSRSTHNSFHVSYQRTELHGKHIKLGKIGKVRIKNNGYIPKCKYNSVTISISGGRWYVSVQVDEEIDDPIRTDDRIVGIDVGVKTFAVLSDGKIYDHPRPIKMMQKKLRRVQKSMSRSMEKNGGRDKNGNDIRGWKPTSNFLKNKDKVSRIHHKIKKIREDFINKTTTEIINNYDIICVEGLKIKNMTKKKKGIGKRGKGANRAMLDQGWGEFVRQLKYKAEWHGKTILVVDTFFPSTKMCSGCGNIKDKMKITERIYQCEKCGLEMDRDLNAGHNLMMVAAGLTETLNACGDGSAGSKLQTIIHGHSVTVEVCGLSETTTVKQELGILGVST